MDAHSHVHKCADPAAAVAGAVASGVSRIVCCATHTGDFDAVAALASAHPGVIIPAYGVHPWWAGSVAAPAALDGALSDIRRRVCLAWPPGCAHIGEIGLDRSPRGLAASGSWEAQEAAFTAQLALAHELGCSVSVHCVRAFEDLLRLLSPYAQSGSKHFTSAASDGSGDAPCGLRGVLLHSWGGPPHVAQRLLAMFPPGGRVRLVFSFQGSIVIPVVEAWLAATGKPGGSASHAAVSLLGAGKAVMSVLAQLPATALALETDAPDQGFGLSGARPHRAPRPEGGSPGALCDQPGGAGCTSTSQACCSPQDPLTLASEESDDDPATSLHAAFERACDALFTHGGPVKCAVSVTGQIPSRVRIVYMAAALWRSTRGSDQAQAKAKAKVKSRPKGSADRQPEVTEVSGSPADNCDERARSFLIRGPGGEPTAVGPEDAASWLWELRRAVSQNTTALFAPTAARRPPAAVGFWI